MPDIEPRPINQSLESAQTRALSINDLIQHAAAGLTPVQVVRAGRKIGRRRVKTVVNIAGTADQGAEESARIIVRTQVRSIGEQAERSLHAERMQCLSRAALEHEEASRIIDLVQDEAAHTVFKDALKGASARYANGVVRRSGS